MAANTWHPSSLQLSFFLTFLFFFFFYFIYPFAGKKGRLTWIRQQPQEQRYRFLPVCAVLSSVQTKVWLPKLGIFNMHTDVNACDCTRGCTDNVRESALKVDSGREKSLAAPGSSTRVSNVPAWRSINWATPQAVSACAVGWETFAKLWVSTTVSGNDLHMQSHASFYTLLFHTWQQRVTVKEHSPLQVQLSGTYCLMDSDTPNLLLPLK